MAFDEKKFMNANFTPRIKDVKVPDLKDFFDAGSEPVFKVRGLTGNELARVHEAVDKHKNIAGLVAGLLSNQSHEKVEAVRTALGVVEDVPAEIAKRLEMLVLGCVDPVVSLEAAVRLSETFPVEFYNITTEITRLTGKGQMLGKPTPSGKTQGSKQP